MFIPNKNKFLITLNKIYQEEINRFTSFHELAHYFFDNDEIRKGKNISSNYFDNVEYHEKYEIIANRFAAEILMPEEKIIDDYISKIGEKKEEYKLINEFIIDLICKEISKEYQVTKMALYNRLLNVGVLKK